MQGSDSLYMAVAQRGVQVMDLERSTLNVALDNWWGAGDATHDNPRLAYEYFIDAQRLAVHDVYQCEGEAVGYYEYLATGDIVPAVQYFTRFLQTAKYKRLMPYWFNPQHDLALMRLVMNKHDNYYLFDAMKLANVRQKWGYSQAKVLRALGKAISDDVWNHRSSEFLNDSICNIGMNIVPKRELGFDMGTGKPCRYGVECRRRDCWFQHARIELAPPLPPPPRHQKSLYEHIIEMSGGERIHYITLFDYHTLSISQIHNVLHQQGSVIELPENKTISQQEAQRRLKKKATIDNNSMAQYLFGKLHREEHVSVLGKSGIQSKQVWKFWSASAIAGNAFGMAGLGLEHRELGHLPTAIIWWERALATADLPEAAYSLGVAYALNDSLNSAEVPVNYEKAASYYAKLVDMDMRLGIPTDDSDESKRDRVHITKEGTDNNDQPTYQTLAISNLRAMERYLAYPDRAPLPDHKEVSPFVESSQETCSCCGRRPREGERSFMRCSQCQKVSYCNIICQVGHWSNHKANCCAKC